MGLSSQGRIALFRFAIKKSPAGECASPCQRQWEFGNAAAYWTQQTLQQGGFRRAGRQRSSLMAEYVPEADEIVLLEFSP
jgi:hypothetical protein